MRCIGRTFVARGAAALTCESPCDVSPHGTGIPPLVTEDSLGSNRAYLPILPSLLPSLDGSNSGASPLERVSDGQRPHHLRHRSNSVSLSSDSVLREDSIPGSPVPRMHGECATPLHVAQYTIPLTRAQPCRRHPTAPASSPVASSPGTAPPPTDHSPSRASSSVAIEPASERRNPVPPRPRPGAG